MSSVLRSGAVVLTERWLDTDQLVPARFCTVGRPPDLAQALLHDLRVSGELKLEVPFPESHRILVAGEGFAAGSGREHAVWALIDAGVSAIVAPSFGATFQRGAVLNGLWPVVLDPGDHRDLVRVLAEDPEALVEIDPDGCRISLSGRARSWPIQWSADEAARISVTTDPLAELVDLIPIIQRFEAARQVPSGPGGRSDQGRVIP